MTHNRHSLVPAVWMILTNEKSQVFLLRRYQTGWRDGWWTAPAGHVDEGEGPTAAAVRELKEEAGVTINESSLGTPLVYMYPTDDLSYERVSLFYFVSEYDGEPKLIEPHKADAGRWFDKNELPEKIVPILGVAIRDLDHGITFSDRFYKKEFHKEIE